MGVLQELSCFLCCYCYYCTSCSSTTACCCFSFRQRSCCSCCYCSSRDSSSAGCTTSFSSSWDSLNQMATMTDCSCCFIGTGYFLASVTDTCCYSAVNLALNYCHLREVKGEALHLNYCLPYCLVGMATGSYIVITSYCYCRGITIAIIISEVIRIKHYFGDLKAVLLINFTIL